MCLNPNAICEVDTPRVIARIAQLYDELLWATTAQTPGVLDQLGDLGADPAHFTTVCFVLHELLHRGVRNVGACEEQQELMLFLKGVQGELEDIMSELGPARAAAAAVPGPYQQHVSLRTYVQVLADNATSWAVCHVKPLRPSQ